MLSFHCKIVFYIIVISVFYLPTNGFAEIVQGKVESKYANESIIYDWFYYIPTTLNTTETHNILLIAEGGNENYAENSSTVKQIINGWTQFAEENGIIILAASIPRGFDKFGQYHYSVSIPISSFSKETVEPYRRPDEKVNQMIDRKSVV